MVFPTIECYWYDAADTLYSTIDTTIQPSRPQFTLQDAHNALQNVKSVVKDRFVTQLTQKGTSADKIAATCVLVQDSPVTNRIFLEKLIKMSRKKSRRVALEVAQSVMDVFIGNLLPQNRRLRRFMHPETQQFLRTCPEKLLKQALGWASFEEWLKLQFAEFITIVKNLMADTVDNVRYSAVKLACNCLSHRPEAEQVWLALLVNKLGDLSGKVSSLTTRMLHDFLHHNPNVLPLAIAEVQELIFRSKGNARCIYNSVIFLSQVRFDQESSELSKTVVVLYLTIFQTETETLLDSKKLNAKLLSALLTGINRALPFCNAANLGVDLVPYMEKVFKIVHCGNFSAMTQALALLYQVQEINDDLSSGRFYKSLYDVLMKPNVIRTLNESSKSNVPLFFNILYRSMNSDSNTRRVTSFIKRLLQLCLFQKPQFICSALFLIAKLKDPEPMTCLLQAKPSTECSYDSSKRDPEYADAYTSCLWELSFLANHYHPSVVKFTNSLMESLKISYSGDPLVDFGTSHFLDNFAFKNPKNKDKQQKMSFSQFGYHKSNVSRKPNPNRPDEVFFHKYFVMKKSQETKRSKKIIDDSQESFENEEQFADALFKQEMVAFEKNDGGDFEEDLPNFSDEDMPDFDFDLEEENESIVQAPEAPTSKTSRAVFAEADEFSQILEDASKNKKDGLEKWFSSKKRKGLDRNRNRKKRKKMVRA